MQTQTSPAGAPATSLEPSVIAALKECYDPEIPIDIYELGLVYSAWLVDPLERTLEIFRLDASRWTFVSAHSGDEVVRAEPFEELELRLADLWLSPETPAAAAPVP